MIAEKPRRPARKPAKPRAATSANPQRGEHELTLARVRYVLRPSFEACRAIEEALGASLIELAREANKMALSLDQLGVICAELIRAGAKPGDAMTRAVSAERIAELIFEEGQGGVLPVVTLALLDAISGGRTASGEAKAVTTTTGQAATAA
jgi:hypothetical protein